MSSTPTALRGLEGDVAADRAVVVCDLRRSFGDREVLRGVDLDIAPGEFVALLGRSGSGKSTILRALAGLDDGVRGDLYVPERRSVVFQDPRLLPWARVLDNVILGTTGSGAVERGVEALGEVGLDGHERDWPKTLSGGEAQRVALARALLREPDLLLLDEPFGALDALTRIKMHALVVQLRQRHHPAVLLVTHDVDEAILLSDRCLVLTEGRIALDRRVDVGQPRRRGAARFNELREVLLGALGVDDLHEGSEHTALHPDAHPDSPTTNRPPKGAALQ
ncbi:MAG: ABC transporter ATP-binding protein [Acidimicrobiales bacterium]